MKDKEAKVLDYKFSDFAHVIHEIVRPDTRVDDLTQELFENIVTEDYEDIIGDISVYQIFYYLYIF